MMVPPVQPPRGLPPLALLLQQALGCVDFINLGRAVSAGAELSMDDLERDGQVAGFTAMRDAMRDGVNARRRAAWRARYGGKEPVGPLTGVVPAIEGAEVDQPGFALLGGSPPQERKPGAQPVPLFPGRRRQPRQG